MITTINRAIAKKREEGEQGFTLIELLVVILIIGVLAAIAIPAFLNQRERSWEAQVETDLKNAAIAAETYAVGADSYVGLTPTTLKAEGFNPTPEVTLTVPTATATEFTLSASRTGLTGSWTYNSTTGVITPPAAPAPAP